MAAIKAKEEKEKEVAKEVNAVPASEPIKEEPVTQVVEHRQSITLMANHYLMEEVKKQTQLLTIISNKLAFVVDELTK